MNIGKSIKLCRTARRMTLADLSESSETSGSYLSQVENDQREVSLKKLNKISAGLGVSISALITITNNSVEFVNEEDLKNLESKIDGLGSIFWSDEEQIKNYLYTPSKIEVLKSENKLMAEHLRIISEITLGYREGSFPEIIQRIVHLTQKAENVEINNQFLTLSESIDDLKALCDDIKKEVTTCERTANK